MALTHVLAEGILAAILSPSLPCSLLKQTICTIPLQGVPRTRVWTRHDMNSAPWQIVPHGMQMTSEAEKTNL